MDTVIDPPTIVLALRNHETGARCVVTWDSAPDVEARAIAYVMARRATHHVDEIEEFPISAQHALLLRVLYPLCEHGLSLELCYGPMHYPPDRPEDDYL